MSVFSGAEAEKKKIYYTERDLDEDVSKIVPWAIERKFKNIYPIPNGGIPLAERLSRKLGLPIITDEKQISGETLVVDDIVDKGGTVFLLQLHTGMIFYLVTIFTVQNPFVKPNFSPRRKRDDQWVVFFWEDSSRPKRGKTLQKKLKERF